MAWKIRHKDGTAVKDANGKEAEVHSLTYDGEWMGECSVTTTAANEAPVEFAVGDWLEYRGERFELNYDPGKAKTARKDSVGDAFKYDSVKWNSLSDELARAEFLDVVLDGEDNNMHYTALPDFVFYMETLDDLLDRLQANMDEQAGKGVWKFYSRNWARSRQRGGEAARWEEMYGGDTAKDDTGVADTVIGSTSVSVQNQTVWEGLAIVDSQFDVNFVTRNREVFVGTAGLPTRNTFRYGKGNGLYEIAQDADSSQKIVTLLRAYGSDKNLPTRYYATLNLQVWAAVSDFGKLEWTGGVRWTFVTDLKAANLSAYFHTVIDNVLGSYAVKVKCGELTAEGKVKKSTSSVTEDRCMVELQSSEEQSVDALNAFAAAAKAAGKVYFVSGATKANFPDGKKDYATENLPDNMSCERLMLPGFPNESLADWWARQDEDTKKRLNPTGAELRFSAEKYRPWVEAAEADSAGVRPGSVYFDTEDAKNKTVEIYPTLKEMTVDGVRVDEIDEGSAVEDNGVFRDGQTVPNFTITLKKELDIDINELKRDDFAVTMTDGMCAGRTFKWSGSVKKGGKWMLTLQRTEDGGVWYPYKDFHISKGDHFVLTGIDMPDEYVEAASEKLLRYAIAWLVANCRTRYTYQPKVDEIFMARQHDEALADATGTKKSLHDTLKEGDAMLIEDEDLGISGQVTIDRLTIREEDGKIPTYEITLRDDKDVGTLQKMQEQITELQSGNGNGGGTTPAQVREIVRSEGAKNFLSKLSPDTAQALITFLKGIALGDGTHGITEEGVAVLEEVMTKAFKDAGLSGPDGAGLWLGQKTASDGSTYSYLEIDRLLVRKVAEFVQLMIRDIRHVGGEIVLSPAAMECVKVERYTASGALIMGGTPAYFRCYFRAEEDGQKIGNEFAVGDMARCQTFNVKGSGVTLTGTANRYYWRMVTAVGDDWIELSATDCDKTVTNSEPQEGDHIVQMGNMNDTTRQAVVTLSAYGADAPAITLYRGVNSYSLSGKEIVNLSAKEVMIIADRLYYTTSQGERKTVAEGFASLADDVAAVQKDLTDKYSSITADMDGIAMRVGATENTLTEQGDEIRQFDSKIEQTAENISLKVAETVQGMENLLEGSSLNLTAEGPAVTGTRKGDAGYKGGYAAQAVNTTSAQLTGVRWWGGAKQGNIRLEKGKTYTMAFWAKCAGTNGTVRCDMVWQGSRTDTSRPGGYTGPCGSGTAIAETGATEWTLLKKTFTVAEDAAYEYAEVFLFNRSSDGTAFTALFSKPILAEGDAYRGWGLAPNEKDDTERGLLATGINIRSRLITVTADMFEIQNNNGDTTACVNEDGLFETEDAKIHGSIYAKDGFFSGFVMKAPCIITPENFGDYATASTQNGYVTLDFTKTGSYVVMKGDFTAVVGSGNEAVLVIPYCSGKGGSADELPDDAFRYIDQKLVIANCTASSIGVPAAALATVQGGAYSTKAEIAPGWMLVLEPKITWSATSSAYSVKWNGWNMKFSTKYGNV